MSQERRMAAMVYRTFVPVPLSVIDWVAGLALKRVVGKDGGAGERAATLGLEIEAELAGCARRAAA